MKKSRAWLISTHFVLILAVALMMVPAPAEAKAVQLRFAWNANSEPDLAGYTLYVGSQPGGPYVECATFGLVTTGDVVLDLVPKTTVYFVLDAFDDSGNHSGFSNEVSYFFEDTEPPGNPAGLRLLF